MKLLGYFLFLSNLLSHSYAADLVIELNGVKSTRGMIRYGLCDNSTCYKEDEGHIANGALAPKMGQTKWTLRNLPPGEYSLTLLHDENNNGEMDYRFFIPQEGFAISNINSKSDLSLRKPKWKRVKFQIPVGGRKLPINLIHW